MINLMYSKAITMQTPQWSFVVRVQNLLNADDGFSTLISLPFLNGGSTQPWGPKADYSFRRILSGMVVTF